MSKLKVDELIPRFPGKYVQNKKFDSSLTNGDFESNVPNKGQTGFQNNPNGVSRLHDETRLYNTENRNVVVKYVENSIQTPERFELHHKGF